VEARIGASTLFYNEQRAAIDCGEAEEVKLQRRCSAPFYAVICTVAAFFSGPFTYRKSGCDSEPSRLLLRVSGGPASVGGRPLFVFGTRSGRRGQKSAVRAAKGEISQFMGEELTPFDGVH